MSVVRFSNAGGFGSLTRYNDFLAGNPAFVADNGSMVPLGIFTLTADQATVTFSNIPQTTFTHLQLRATSLSSLNAGSYSVSLNGDATATNYRWHRAGGDGSITYAQNGQQVPIFGGSSITASILIVDILDYRNTNKNTVLRGLSGYDANGSGQIWIGSALWINTAAVTSISIKPDGSGHTFSANSTFALYGVSA